MSPATKPRVQDEDDDLDDLDDIVDQFDSTPTKPPPPPPPTSVPTISVPSSSKLPLPQPRVPAPAEDLSDDFAKQLAEGMETLMRELGSPPDGSGTDDDRKRQEAWEKMLIEGMNGVNLGVLDEDTLPAAGPDGGPPKGGPSAQGQDEDAFQRSIRQAMEKLKDSDSTLKTDASASASSTDPLEALLGRLGTGLETSGDSDEELQGMLETMMQQLMSKEVLYEPLKELHDKFPGYLTENASKISAEDKTRYKNQLDCVSKIIVVFEDPSYDDENTDKNTQIVNLMNEMQSFGSPPTEILGDLPPGFDFGPDGMPKMPDGCVIS